MHYLMAVNEKYEQLKKIRQTHAMHLLISGPTLIEKGQKIAQKLNIVDSAGSRKMKSLDTLIKNNVINFRTL